MTHCFSKDCIWVLALCAVCIPLASAAVNVRNPKFVHGELKQFYLGTTPAFVAVPKGPIDSARRWVWISPASMVFTKHKRNPMPTQVEYEVYVEAFLARGFHVGGIRIGASLGSLAGVEAFQKFYKHVTDKYQLNPMVRMLSQSNGGLMAYAWAFRNSEKVDRIVGIYPVLDLRSWPGLEGAAGPNRVGHPVFGFTNMDVAELTSRLSEFNPIDNLKPLADAGVKILNVHGDSDRTVPFDANSGEEKRRYEALGGDIEVICLPGKGHDPGPGFYDSSRVVDFLIATPGLTATGN